jgi:catalase (peroxidase I)
MVENETLKKEVNELTHALGKAYGGEDQLLICLGNRRASIYKQGLGYTPKKGKAAFAPQKTSFVKNNGRFYTSCNQVGHIEKNA